MNIAKRLAELMKKKGNMSRSRLARELKVHTSTVSNWLDGKPPKSENLADLCKYFETDVEYLTGETDEQNKKSPHNSPEDEVWELRREMSERSEMKTLFDLSRNATKEDIEFVNEMLKRMKGDDVDE